MQKVNLQPIKGFRDFYPNQMAFRNWLFEKAKKASRLFGYEEYEGPILEPISLYKVKSGEELVKNQTFQLKDKGNRRLALRPELTPTLARMIANQKYKLPIPIRWFSIGPRFRYEAPQKGRARQFYQWDVDLIGPNTEEADMEIIALACKFFQELKLTPKEIVIKINDRRLLESELSLINIAKDKVSKVFKAIDKKDKVSKEVFVKLLIQEGLTEKQIKKIELLLKNRSLFSKSKRLTKILKLLKKLSFADYIEFDPTIVRGLDYYTGIVFEARDKKGKFRAILGGGRYDNLIENFSKTKLSGIGFALGDMVITEVLKKYDKYPKLKFINPNPTQVLVTVFDQTTLKQSLKIALTLRNNNVNTEIYPDTNIRLDKQLKYADRKGIPFVIILGPEEIKNNQITLKNLITRKQETSNLNNLTKKIHLYLTSDRKSNTNVFL